jgi:hypothetical protein
MKRSTGACRDSFGGEDAGGIKISSPSEESFAAAATTEFSSPWSVELSPDRLERFDRLFPRPRTFDPEGVEVGLFPTPSGEGFDFWEGLDLCGFL